MPSASLRSWLTAPALEGTFLTRLPVEARDALIETGKLLEVAQRRPIFGSADHSRAGFLLDGLARTYLSDHNGQQLTVRYARVGDLVGNISGAAARRAPLSVAAVTDCVLVEVDIATLFELVSSDTRVGLALIGEITLRLQDSYATLGANTLGSMAERVAWHLLDVATEAPGGERLIAGVTQQQLADSVGTAREVVARVLRVLRADGIIVTGKEQIEILDPERLAAIAGRVRD